MPMKVPQILIHGPSTQRLSKNNRNSIERNGQMLNKRRLRHILGDIPVGLNNN